jgi:Protein of unknown function (DUF3987)/RepB DNA-primase from phage plasmid/Primase C terminal 1 (PriCT-1)
LTATTELYQAEELWHHIFSSERGLLHIWTAIRDEDGSLIKAKSANFHYPKAADAAAQWALEQSDKGREVYFCAHLLMGPERRKENASAVHALWFEKDGGEIPNGRLAPSAVVESSPGRYHCYLRLTDPIPPETAEALNKRLVDAAGADPSGADLTQILRVPETTNHKYSDRPVVKVLDLEDSRTYMPAELEKVLPSGVPETEKRTAPEVGERIASGGRNNELTSIGGTMRRRGLEEEEIAAALLAVNERRCDPPLGEAEVRAIAHSLAGYRPETSTAAYDSNVSNDSVFHDLADLPDPEEFPISALPITLRQFVREAAASVGCPIDYIGLSTLAAVSAAIGDTRRIVIKRDWTEGPAIFAMIVGGAASKKTPAMNLALRPVRERQMALKTEYERQKEEYKAELAHYIQALKDDPGASEPEKPKLGRIYADDTTVERLADILNENRRGLLIIKDELSGWLGAMNQYKQGGRGADRQFWLSVHTNQPVSVDRKSLEEPVIVARPFVSIIGGIQPEVLPDFGKDRGDGLIDRFIPVYPKPGVGRWTDDEISDHVHEEYKATLGRLYKLRHANEDEDPFPSRVPMTDEAKAQFVAEYNRLHEELEAPGFPQRLRPAWGKLEAYFARFALILAMGRIAELDDQGKTGVAEKVTRDDMAGAAQLLAYFKNHVRRVYSGLYGDSPADRLAADLRDFLINQGGLWEGIATELHKDLASEHKPARPEDLAKAVRGIVKRSPLLKLEYLKRTQDRRPFRLTLRNAVIADIAVMPEAEDARAEA